MTQEEKINTLHPYVGRQYRILQMKCFDHGINIRIDHGLRTWNEQNELYASGRTKPGKIITNARGGFSWHNFGLAFDILLLNNDGSANWNTNSPSWALSRALADELKFERVYITAANGKKWLDYPHMQYTAGMTLQEARTFYRASGLTRVWEEFSKKL